MAYVYGLTDVKRRGQMRTVWFSTTLLLGVVFLAVGLLELFKGWGDPFWPLVLGVAGILASGISAHKD